MSKLRNEMEEARVLLIKGLEDVKDKKISELVKEH